MKPDMSPLVPAGQQVQNGRTLVFVVPEAEVLSVATGREILDSGRAGRNSLNSTGRMGKQFTL